MTITLGDVLVLIKGELSPLRQAFKDAEGETANWKTRIEGIAKNAVMGGIGLIATGVTALATAAFSAQLYVEELKGEAY